MSGTAVTGEAARNPAAGTGGRVRGAAVAVQLRGGYLGRCVLLVAAYYAAAHLGYALRFAGPVASVVWLPVGVGIAGLCLFGLQFWPAVVVGDLLVNNYSALPLGSAIGQSFGNLLEIVIAAALLRRLATRRNPLSTSPGMAGMLLALAAGTIVSASVGSVSLALGHVIRASSLPHVWATWWLGDFCGAVIIVSLALAFFSAPAKPWLRGHAGEAALLLITAVVLSTVAVQTGQDLSYLAFPALVWAALRFGPHEHLDHLGVDHGAALGHRVNRRRQFGGIADAFLQQVGAAGTAALQQPQNVIRVHELAEDDDARVGMGGPKLSRHLDALVGSGGWHADVRQNDVRTRLADSPQERISIAIEAQDLDPLQLGDDALDRLAHQERVLADHYADRFTALL
jgi:integral membrane sensor domain MASE1